MRSDPAREPAPPPAPSAGRRRFAAALALAASPLAAQDDPARADGALLWYTSMRREDAAALGAAFERRSGIPVAIWRAGSERVLQRALAEARAGRHDVDVVEASGADVHALADADVLAPIASPWLDRLLPAAVPAHRKWAGTRVNLVVQGFNTRLVDPGELPRGWQDLHDPRWRDRLGAEAESGDWFGALVTAPGGPSVESFRAVFARNGVSVRTGHAQLANLVAAGEVPLALNLYEYQVRQLQRAGAPVGSVRLAPAIGQVNAVGVARRSPRADAARRFVDFRLGDGQVEAARRDFLPSRTDLLPRGALDGVRLLDPAAARAQHDRWVRLYADVLAAGRR